MGNICELVQRGTHVRTLGYNINIRVRSERVRRVYKCWYDRGKSPKGVRKDKGSVEGFIEAF